MIETKTPLLNCMLDIENLPVREGLVKSPGPYKWSSYKFNAQGKKNSLISPHKNYQALAKTEKTRLERYTNLSKAGLSDEIKGMVQSAWQTGTPLGSDSFKKMVEQRLKIKVGYAQRGRPRKTPA